MTMRQLKISQYIDEFYPDANLTPQTIRNWLRRGILKGKQTPTRQWLVIVEEKSSIQSHHDNVQELLNIMSG